MRSLIRKRPFLSFYVTAVVIACFVVYMRQSAETVWPIFWEFLEEKNLYTNLLSLFTFAQDYPVVYWVFVFAGSPTIAAVIIAWAGWGWAGVRHLGSRLLPWRAGVGWRRGLAVYAVLFLVLFASAGFAIVTQYFMGAEGALDDRMAALGPSVWMVYLTLALGVFLDEGGTLEELGWRGFALPILLSRLSPVTASLVLGFLWWLWHFPREIPGLLTGGDTFMAVYGSYGRFAWLQFQFIVLCVGLSVICTYIFNLTGGSAIAGIVVHGGTNVLSKTLYVSFGGFGLRDLLVFAVAISLVILTSGRLGQSKEAQAHVWHDR